MNSLCLSLSLLSPAFGNNCGNSTQSLGRFSKNPAEPASSASAGILLKLSLPSPPLNSQQVQQFNPRKPAPATILFSPCPGLRTHSRQSNSTHSLRGFSELLELLSSLIKSLCPALFFGTALSVPSPGLRTTLFNITFWAQVQTLIGPIRRTANQANQASAARTVRRRLHFLLQPLDICAATRKPPQRKSL